MHRLMIRADWTIVHTQGRHVPVEGLCIIIENGRIADLTREPPSEGETITVPGGIAFPGFINLHNHTINGPLFRGIVDDLPRTAIGESRVYTMLMPMGALAVTHLDPDELEALVALGLLEYVRSGQRRLSISSDRGRPLFWNSQSTGGCGCMRRPTSSRPPVRSGIRRLGAPRRAALKARPGFPLLRSCSPVLTKGNAAAFA
jgi:cytosine/adenosine deaminase-related metal-dependent hydrolase